MPPAVPRRERSGGKGHRQRKITDEQEANVRPYTPSVPPVRQSGLVARTPASAASTLLSMLGVLPWPAEPNKVPDGSGHSPPIESLKDGLLPWK